MSYEVRRKGNPDPVFVCDDPWLVVVTILKLFSVTILKLFGVTILKLFSVTILTV